MLGCFEAEKYPAKYKSTAKSVPVIWIQFFKPLELITFLIAIKKALKYINLF